LPSSWERLFTVHGFPFLQMEKVVGNNKERHANSHNQGQSEIKMHLGIRKITGGEADRILYIQDVLSRWPLLNESKHEGNTYKNTHFI